MLQEGELIRRKAADDIEHERVAEQQRRERAHEAVMASKKANDYLQVPPHIEWWPEAEGQTVSALP